jgi:heme-degrading monooxygenase HmoA
LYVRGLPAPQSARPFHKINCNCQDCRGKVFALVIGLSRVKVANGCEDAVREALLKRPGLVDGVAGFLGLEAFTESTDASVFYLVTRWTDAESFQRWHSSPEHAQSQRGIPKGLKLDPSFTAVHTLKRLSGACNFFQPVQGHSIGRCGSGEDGRPGPDRGRRRRLSRSAIALPRPRRRGLRPGPEISDRAAGSTGLIRGAARAYQSTPRARRSFCSFSRETNCSASMPSLRAPST